MDATGLQIGLAIGSLALGGVVWLIRLEGRQNTHEGICTERWTETRKKLEHMDEKLDRLVSR